MYLRIKEIDPNLDGRRKIKVEDIEEIKFLRENKKVRIKMLAEMYGVSRITIMKIVHDKYTYKMKPTYIHKPTKNKTNRDYWNKLGKINKKYVEKKYE